MKKVLNIFLIGFIALISLNGCEKDKLDFGGGGAPDGEGKISLAKLSVDVSNAENVIARSSSVDLSNYIVNIVDKVNDKVVNTWKYSNLPEIITLPVGDYKAEVKSHDVKPAAWDEPYFYGSQDFSIVKDEITEIAKITCSLQNVKVTIKYSDELKAVLGTDVNVNVEVSGGGSLDFAYSETRAGYFQYIDGATLVATFTGTVDGYMEKGYKIFVDIAPGQHRIITFSLKESSPDIPDEFGEIVPLLTLNATVKTIDLTQNVPADEEIIEPDPKPEDPDKPVDPDPDPEPGEETLTITSQSLDIDGVNKVVSGMVAEVDINSDNGITEFTVDIISDQLTNDMLQGVGLASHLDLVNPGSLEEGLKSLNFPVKDQVKNQTYVKFAITDFMPMLGFYQGTHKFKLTVKDSKGVSLVKTLTFLVE